ncbi:MAG TPA: hypothetical protein VHN77_08385, partial [Phycisphaerales bacterium]|nr:hypothetical protein [Phycisphaerales bacterium]
MIQNQHRWWGHVAGTSSVIALGVFGGTALADWPTELVRTAEVINTSCNTNFVGGMVFDLANLPVVAWQENPACAGDAIRPYWGRRSAGGAWSSTRVFDNSTAWPSLLRGNVALTISTSGTPFMAYYSGWPAWEAFGSPTVAIILVDLLAQPSGPGIPAGYIGTTASCTVSNPIGDVAIAPGTESPAAMLVSRCDCTGGVAVGYGVVVGGGFAFRTDVGPYVHPVSSSLGVTSAGASHIVYSGSQCSAGDFLRHCAAATPGAFNVIDSTFNGRSDFAVSSTGVFHVAGIRTSGQVVYTTSTDNGVTWTPLAPV